MFRPISFALTAALLGWGPAALAQSAACKNPTAQCGALLAPECLSALGAGAIAATSPQDCPAQMAAYRECLAEVVAECPAERPQPQQNAAADRLDELARLGGLIAEPTTVVEFYNNALVFARRGDALSQRRMLEKAIAEGGDSVDLHQRYTALVKAQEGLLGAREIIADLAARAPDNLGAQLAAATIGPAPQREAALRALAERHPRFGPVWFEIAQMFSADRVGVQSLDDKRSEKAALEAFNAADERGQVYRWFLEKDAVEAQRVSVARRLALYDTINVDVAPVRLQPQASNDGWLVQFIIAEPVKKIRYRVDGGDIKETGMTEMVNPSTGDPIPWSFTQLPSSAREASIEVWYDDIRGQEQGPFALEFNAQSAFTRSTRNILENVTQKWIEGRVWDDRFLVYFTHLLSYRCAIAEIQYSVDSDALDQVWPQEPCDLSNPYSTGENAQIYAELPEKPGYIIVRLRYADGETSEARRFEF